MKTTNSLKFSAITAAVLLALGGCSGMSTQDKNTSIGAGIGTAAIGRATGKLMGDSETAIFSGAKSAAASPAASGTG